jgi:hypothetical protein
LWQKENKLEFGKRLAEADEGFCNMLEGHAVKLALETKAGQNPVLLIALLNANLPDKYRPQSVQIDGKAEETLVTLRKLSRNATIALETEKRRLTGAEETEGSQSSSAIGEAESILRQHTR